MSNTKQILDFVRNTTHALESLSDQLASVRFDLFGTRTDPSVPTATKDRESSPLPCFVNEVEFFAGRTSEALNHLAIEIEHLRERVNHVESPKGKI